MDRPLTAMEIFKALPRTSCKECGLPTCLAFAGAVFKGERPLQDCPYAPAELTARVSGGVQEQQQDEDQRRAEQIARLAEQMDGVDLAQAVQRVDGFLRGDRLAIHCLGKIFEIDARGGLHSECHVNPWIHGPLLDHVLHATGDEPGGAWAPFEQLDGARDWVRFFDHRCEQGLHRLADEDPDLFLDALALFGKPLPAGAADTVMASADEVVLLRPLPRVPLVVCYWRAEDGFESRLAVRFDLSVQASLGCESLYQLCQGILEMLRRIMARHGHDPHAAADGWPRPEASRHRRR